MNRFRKIALTGISIATIAACGTNDGSWTEAERNIIEQADTLLHVYSIDIEQETSVLRAKSIDLSDKDINSPLYAKLCHLMLATVQSPAHNGVGIAGPQVGISRNLIAVQRFDKEGEPFELYPNIKIVNASGEMEIGNEGCLSVPGKKGKVPRFRHIDISYRLADGRDTTETVKGYTAIIFQHEFDHLQGVLYTDRASEVTMR